MENEYIDIVFDGPPSHESGRFIEVENSYRRSINFGEWVDRGDYWALRIPDYRNFIAERDKLRARLEAVREWRKSYPRNSTYGLTGLDAILSSDGGE